LEHSGLQRGVKRFQIVKWWGNLNNRKLKTDLQRFEYKCPVCGGPMEDTFLPRYIEPIVTNRGERGFVKNFAVDHVDHELIGGEK